VEILQWRLWEI